MDFRLFESAREGNVSLLYELLDENPLILNFSGLLTTENPLHCASLAGHLDFVKEILRLKPEFAGELNQDGFSPLHIASALGHLEIVKELLKIDPKLSRLEGREKMTCFHMAACRGRAGVVYEMLSCCADCIEDLTAQEETALHLAVNNNQYEALKVMVDMMRELRKEDILNKRDGLGNTILHLATWKKQHQVIKLLLCNGNMAPFHMDVNAINASGLTALDLLLIFQSEAGDREIMQMLQSSGAMRARDILMSSSPSTESHDEHQENIPITANMPKLDTDNLVEYFKFKRGRDSPSEARSALLVIAVLVATATFQVGLSPPGGVWQDDSFNQSNNSSETIKTNIITGSSIMGHLSMLSFAFFLFFNTVGFSFSLFIIDILTSKFPLRVELQICLIAMSFTYGTSLVTIAPKDVKIFALVVTTVVPVTVQLVGCWVREHKTMLRMLCRRLSQSVT